MMTFRTPLVLLTFALAAATLLVQPAAAQETVPPGAQETGPPGAQETGPPAESPAAAATESPATDSPASESIDEAQAGAIAGWIDDLASDRYVVRERSTRQLAAAGRGAIEPLARAADGSNLEVASRALRLLFRLSEGDNPDLAIAVLERIAVLKNRPAERAVAESLLDGVREQHAIATVKRFGAEDRAPVIKDGQVGIGHLHVGEKWTGGDAGLKHVGRLKMLQRLSIYSTPITDRGLTHLEGLESAVSIELFGTGVSEKGVATLRKALPNTDIQVRAGALLGIRGSLAGNGNGAQVLEVQPNTAAQAAGLQPGDLITSIDGNKTPDFTTLTGFIAKHKPGDSVKLTIDRNGRELTKEVRFGKWR